MLDTLHTGQEVREKLMAGINKVASAVAGTMGTAGSNAIIEAIENPGHLVTNDGWMIATSMRLQDPIEEMGRKILVEAISRANKQSGDGSSTTTVLTAALIQEGMKLDTHPMVLKRELESFIPLIEKSLNEQKREITVNEVGAVAAISAEDDAIGALIQEIYQQIGPDGIIHWDISKTSDDTYTVGSGITINGAGFISPYMCDVDEKSGNLLNQARWKNSPVLITKQKITSAGEFEALFANLNAREIKEVVIFCDEIEATVIPDLIKTRIMRGFKTLVVKMPTLWKDEWYEDLALATGATIIDPNAGLTFKLMKPEHLGNVGNIVVTKDETFLDGIKDLADHIAELKTENTDATNLRASRLNVKTARLFVGAPSDSALSYKRLKVEDAISAAWQALHGGIVPGGGVALVNVADVIPETEAGNVLSTALCTPFHTIVKNAGGTMDIHEVTTSVGFNTRTMEKVDMFDAQITDPTAVVLNACRNAISVAATILTANTLVTLPREDTPYGQ